MCRIKGLNTEPFSKFSAEEELDILDDIFYTPPFYNELLNLLQAGNSRFILGQRGQGKSAVIHKLFTDLSKRGVMPLLITRYDNIPLTNNATHLLYKIAYTITVSLSKTFFYDKKKMKLLTTDQKKKLYQLVELFYDQSWTNEFMAEAKNIKKKNRCNFILRCFNKHLRLINKIADGVVNVSKDAIRGTIFGNAFSQTLESHCNYFSEAKLEEFNTKSIKDITSDDRASYVDILQLLLDVSKAIGYKAIVVLFDKIDENPFLESDVNQISDFMKDLLSDTDLLYTQNLGIVCALWTEVKLSLNQKNVRFDKFKDVDIRWSDDELEKLINHRLKFYSIDSENPVSLSTLLPDDDTRKNVIGLAHNSPRSLLSLLSSIYYIDGRTEISTFSTESVSKGMIKFCKEFDYISLLPFKHSKRNDVHNWINKLLSLRLLKFTIQEYSQSTNNKAATSNTHIKELMKLGLVRISSETGIDEAPIYEIVDPRIKHLISRGEITLEKF